MKSKQKPAQAEPIASAVRKLRTLLGETQQEFANTVKTAIRTIARYETVRPPSGEVLLQLAAIAKDRAMGKHKDVAIPLLQISDFFHWRYVDEVLNNLGFEILTSADRGLLVMKLHVEEIGAAGIFQLLVHGGLRSDSPERREKARAAFRALGAVADELEPAARMIQKGLHAGL